MNYEDNIKSQEVYCVFLGLISVQKDRNKMKKKRRRRVCSMKTVAVVLINIYGDSMFPLSLIMYYIYTQYNSQVQHKKASSGMKASAWCEKWRELRNIM